MKPKRASPARMHSAAGDEGEHAGQRHQAIGVAGGQRHDRGGDDGRQRRVRSQHQDAARPEDGVRDQRDDGGVEAVDGGQAGGFGVAHADRDEDGREHQPRHEVLWPARPADRSAARREPGSSG